MAFKVFITAAKLIALLKPLTFDQIWNMTLTLNPTLQILVRKKLKAAIMSLPPMIFESVRSIIESHTDGISPMSHQNR